jgi:hypothetical protein
MGVLILGVFVGRGSYGSGNNRISVIAKKSKYIQDYNKPDYGFTLRKSDKNWRFQ